jgi:hypothetical protein
LNGMDDVANDDETDERDIISIIFRGSIKQIMNVTGKENEEERIIESFAAIMIRIVGFKEIYEAWENQYQTIISEYRRQSFNGP